MTEYYSTSWVNSERKKNILNKTCKISNSGEDAKNIWNSGNLAFARKYFVVLEDWNSDLEYFEKLVSCENLKLKNINININTNINYYFREFLT